MLVSHDRSCDGVAQFRLEMYESMKVCLTMNKGVYTRNNRSDGDRNGYRYDLVTPVLPLGEETHLSVRRLANGRFEMYVNFVK